MDDSLQQHVSINTIGIIGTGVMGIQLSVLFLQAGFNVTLKSRTNTALQNAKSKITQILRRREGSTCVLHYLKKLVLTTNFSDLMSAGIIIECVIEDILVKTQVFQRLSTICPEPIILATNTSSLSITELSEQVIDSGRFIGMHFFNPAHKMRLVEIIRSSYTSTQTLETVLSLVKQLDKTPLVLYHSPGFIVNRLLFALLNEAVHLVEQGHVTETEIDLAVKLGLNHPMGPFELMDFIGRDTCVIILNNLYQATGNPQFSPSERLQDMVKRSNSGCDHES